MTDDDDLAIRMREFINHGENVGLGIGLNLRMPDVCAGLAVARGELGASSPLSERDIAHPRQRFLRRP